jgi:signal transduction histidine kinase
MPSRLASRDTRQSPSRGLTPLLPTGSADYAPSTDRRPRPDSGAPPALVVVLVSLLVTGAACLAAVALTPAAGRSYVAASAGTFAVLLSFALGGVAYGLRQADRARSRAADVDARFARLVAENARLAEETVPGLVKRLRDGASAGTALADLPGSVDGPHYSVLRTLAEEVGRSERMRAAAMSACANAAGRVQALATSMLADLRDMEERHDEKVLGDLLRLDHSTAQAGRLADSIAVLTGARSGRRWTKPIVMESILRGAVGRINAYQRVRVHSTSSVAIAGYAAEGVMHALAELMDNAANFSPPTEEVHVYVEDTQNGVIVTIEDGGLVMGPAALQRAEQAVSADVLDLTTLSGTRLGLAVVGCLARKHNLTVSFRPSSRGGTGVVVMLPRQLLAQPRPASRRGAVGGGGAVGGSDATSAVTSTAAGRPAAAAVTAPVGAVASEVGPGSGRGFVSDSVSSSESAVPSTATSRDVETFGHGHPANPDHLLEELPKRQRGETLASAPRPSAAGSRPARPRVDPGTRFGAFRDASRRRAADPRAAAADATSAGPTSSGPTSTGLTTTGPTSTNPAAVDAVDPWHGRPPRPPDGLGQDPTDR